MGVENVFCLEESQIFGTSSHPTFGTGSHEITPSSLVACVQKQDKDESEWIKSNVFPETRTYCPWCVTGHVPVFTLKMIRT